MIKTKTNTRLLALLLMFIFASSVSATPRVAVSIPSLHSLVSSLMEGAAEPALLLGPDNDYSAKMDPFQKSQLITADIVIWVGPGLETPIAQTLDQLPMLDNHLITLSNHVPLLTRVDFEGPIASRQVSRDLNFWTDPRLAIMAVRMITPQLVRLDPEHQELYLDNEIALIKKLKTLEQEISAMLIPYTNHLHTALVGVDRYFSHRFIAMTDLKFRGTDSLRKVSLVGATTCSAAKTLQKNTIPSSTYYFEAMRLTAQSVISCMNKSQGRTTVSKQDKRDNHKT